MCTMIMVILILEIIRLLIEVILIIGAIVFYSTNKISYNVTLGDFNDAEDNDDAEEDFSESDWIQD